MAIAAFLLAVRLPRPTTYGDGSMSTAYEDLVASMDDFVRPGDLVLLTPFSRWNVGYDTARPLEVSFAQPEDERLFDFRLTSPESRMVRNLPKELRRRDLPRRVVFVALLMGADRLELHREVFRERGWILEEEVVKANRGSAVQVWRRPGPSRRPPASSP